jgi:hypothetical protein
MSCRYQRRNGGALDAAPGELGGPVVGLRRRRRGFVGGSRRFAGASRRPGWVLSSSLANVVSFASAADSAISPSDTSTSASTAGVGLVSVCPALVDVVDGGPPHGRRSDLAVARHLPLGRLWAGPPLSSSTKFETSSSDRGLG